MQACTGRWLRRSLEPNRPCGRGSGRAPARHPPLPSGALADSFRFLPEPVQTCLKRKSRRDRCRGQPPRAGRRDPHPIPPLAMSITDATQRTAPERLGVAGRTGPGPRLRIRCLLGAGPSQSRCGAVVTCGLQRLRQSERTAARGFCCSTQLRVLTQTGCRQGAGFFVWRQGAPEKNGMAGRYPRGSPRVMGGWGPCGRGRVGFRRANRRVPASRHTRAIRTN
jgi:hypothetical protein